MPAPPRRTFPSESKPEQVSPLHSGLGDFTTAAWQADLGELGASIWELESGCSSWHLESGNSIRKEISAKFQQITSIKNRQILKGIPVSKAMGRFGCIFDVGGDPEEHMAMSEPVSRLQDFISHNWIVPRWLKWFVLALHYNTRAATVAGLGTGAAVALLTMTGLLPVLSLPLPYDNAQGSFLLGHAALFLVFAFWQDIRCVLLRTLPPEHLPQRFRERMAFVDKACIHQTDQELLLEGIRNLAGFLRRAETMVIVYSPSYLKKLWTVYELASFLSIHKDPSRVLIFPTSWALPVANTLLTIFGTRMLLHLLTMLGVYREPVVAAFVIYFSASILYSLRQWEKSLFAMEESMRNFSIRRAHCALESDRSLVQGNISIFIRELGRVAESAPEEECLESFDELVRQELAGSVLHSFIQTTFARLLQLATAVPLALVIFDEVSLAVSQGEALKGLEKALEKSPALYSILLHSNLLSPLLSRNLHFHGLREAAYLLFILLLILLSFFATRLVLDKLSTGGRAREQQRLFLGLQLAHLCLMASLTFLSGRLRDRCGPRKGPLSPSKTFDVGASVSV